MGAQRGIGVQTRVRLEYSTLAEPSTGADDHAALDDDTGTDALAKITNLGSISG